MHRKGRLLVTLCAAIAIGLTVAWLAAALILAIDFWRRRR
jgi:hypothetical protein